VARQRRKADRTTIQVEEPIGEDADLDPGFESRFPAIGDRECRASSVFSTFRWGASCGNFI